MALYKRRANFIRRSIKCRRHDAHLHQSNDSVILVAALPRWAGAVNYAVFELLEAEEQGERSFAAFQSTSS
jgi:hypothetical protein